MLLYFYALKKCGLFENVEMIMQSFRAFYEDAAKMEAAARAEGYTGDNGSLMDFVEPSDYRTGKTFQNLAQAEEWLKTEIEAMKTVFGCGTIRTQERVSHRCRYLKNTRLRTRASTRQLNPGSIKRRGFSFIVTFLRQYFR